MSPDAQTVAGELRERGYALLDALYSPAEIGALRESLDALHERFGKPAFYSREPVWIADHVEVARPGLAFYQLLRFAPELASRLFTPSALAAIRALLGEDMHLELVGAVMSDETRPFTEWESHLGGIDDERWRLAGKRPRNVEVRRVVHFLFLEDLDEATGPWRVLPRAVGDAVDPPASTGELEWPGHETIHCRAGTVLLLEESVWHAVVPRERPGTRRFIGAYFASAGAESTFGRDTSLDELDAGEVGPLFSSLLAQRPGR